MLSGVQVHTVSGPQGILTPEIIETEVTRKVEDSVATVNNVKRVMSTVSEGISTTSIEFELEADLATARGSFVEPTLDERLPEELTARERDNRELQRLIAYLQLLGSQRSAGFVAPLTALTEQHPQSGLWLSGISLREGGRQIRLQGRSQDQELLPQYLQRLGQSAVFSGREFARFDVQRGDDQLLHFDLSSQLKDKEAGNE